MAACVIESALLGDDVSAGFIVNIVKFLTSVQDIANLCLLSKRYFEATLDWIKSPPAGSIPLWVPLVLRRSVPPAKNNSCRIVSGVQFEQTAVLLGPRIWGHGRIVPTQVEIVMASYKALGHFSFGVVPDDTFHRNAQKSRLSAYTFDGLGRLYMPGESKQTKKLYGKRLSEGDSLALLVRPVPGGNRSVECSFLINGENLGVAFSLDIEQAYSPVMYFYPMIDTSAVTVSLPQITGVPTHPSACMPEGLFFNNYGPDLTSWVHIPIDNKIYQSLTVGDLQRELAKRLTDLGPSLVHASQITLLIDGEQVDDGKRQLQGLIEYCSGTHLEVLHWHLVHLTS
eukprot:TRINITY_DN21009_c0_g1_i2.p1 TRINITY_DN21009_c0_g1~~TRINITY_DN21009_c0_g1_i2.p1  ORF type:complete len:341 (+),score=23.20 TRINITY_DN21009_c0_g1_i2:49-1071(+)